MAERKPTKATEPTKAAVKPDEPKASSPSDETATVEAPPRVSTPAKAVAPKAKAEPRAKLTREFHAGGYSIVADAPVPTPHIPPQCSVCGAYGDCDHMRKAR